MSAQLISGAPATIAAERGALTPLFPAGATDAAASLGTIGSWGSAIALPYSFPLGCHPRELSVWVVSHYTDITAGAFTLDVSHDGVTWIDAGMPAVSISHTDGAVVVGKINIYANNAGVPSFNLPARYVRFHVSTALVSTGHTATVDGFLVV